MLYNALPASIAYMTCCGGYTESAERVWGTAYPYLGGVSDPYCANAPSRDWSVRVPCESFVQESGARGTLQRIELAELSSGGRPGSLRFIGSEGEGKISSLRLRSLSGWRLPSTFIRSVQIERNGAPVALNTAQFFEDDMNDDLNRGGRLHAAPQRPAPDESWSKRRHRRAEADGGITLVFQGSGSGHGVGLCQWGAYGMAKAGATAQDIVAHYFPATRLGGAAHLAGKAGS